MLSCVVGNGDVEGVCVHIVSVCMWNPKFPKDVRHHP